MTTNSSSVPPARRRHDTVNSFVFTADFTRAWLIPTPTNISKARPVKRTVSVGSTKEVVDLLAAAAARKVAAMSSRVHAQSLERGVGQPRDSDNKNGIGARYRCGLSVGVAGTRTIFPTQTSMVAQARTGARLDYVS